MNQSDPNLALFYEGPYYMYSNFAAFAVRWKRVVCMTSEHHYQAEKFLDIGIKSEIWCAPSAHDAKKIAQAYASEVRPDWDDEEKLGVMEEIVRAKHAQHPYIQRKLKETKGLILVEDSPVDPFWGRGPDWKGLNHLALIWMKIRDE